MHPTLAHVINGKQLKAFLENYSELSVEFISSDKLGDLVGEGIDIALYVGELPSSGLIANRLLDTRVITVAAPAYLAKHVKIAHPNDLLQQEHTLIDYRNPETGRTFQWEYHRGRPEDCEDRNAGKTDCKRHAQFTQHLCGRLGDRAGS